MKTGFLFVHSSVDDAGLSASQFRLLGHLARRAGSDGIINSSVENMRKVTGLSPCTIKNCLRELTKRNIIFVAEQREGQTPVRRINPPDDWKPRPVGKTTGVEKHTGSEIATTPGRKNHPPPGMKFHPQRVSIEGDPFEGNQHVFKKTSTSSDDDDQGFLKQLEGISEDRRDFILKFNEHAGYHSHALLPVDEYTSGLADALDVWEGSFQDLSKYIVKAVENFTVTTGKRLTLVRLCYDAQVCPLEEESSAVATDDSRAKQRTVPPIEDDIPF